MSIERVFLAFGVLIVLLAAAPASHAQNKPPTLATVTELKCVFPMIATGTWTKEGDAQAEAKKSEFTIVYESIDTQDGSAQVKGFIGNFYITVRLVSGNLHLLAMDGGGPVYIKTVFNQPAHPGKFKAVHSRHEFTPVSLPGFTSRPEQYYGECELVK